MAMITRITDLALKQQRGYQLLNELAECGSRLPGSESSYRAIDWAEDILSQAGCSRVWRQDVMVPYWRRGPVERARLVSADGATKTELSIAALGGSVGTGPEGVTAEVMQVMSFDELAAAGSRARGKIIFFNRPFDQTHTNTFKGYSDAVDQRTRGAIEAAGAGGVAALVRSVTTRNDDVPHVGLMRYADSLPKIPAAAISVQDADFLASRMEQAGPVELTMHLSCENRPDTMSYNIIGEITGAEFPEHIIVVGGHFDAWDKGDGAHDDGAGCIQAIRVLELFRDLGIRPRHTIRCVLFIDEEQAQSGAVAYADSARASGENHLAAIESDRGAFTPRGFSVESDSLSLLRLQSWLPNLFDTGIHWIRPGGSGVDIRKIPDCPLKIGFVPDDERYFDVHHSDNDIVSSVHPREMAMGTAAIASLVYLIDTGYHPPGK